MNKSDLVKRVARRTGLGEVGTKVTIEKMMEVLEEAFERGEGLELRGFGTFKVVHVQPKVGRNPRTGETIQIPAGRKVRFTFSYPLSPCPDSSR